MDKTQKSLLDTYLRKREIQTGDYGYGMFGERGGIKPYELIMMIKNHVENPKKITGNNISEIIKYNPKMYYDKDIQPYLSAMSDANKSNLLQHRPEFIDILDKKDVDSLNGDSISLILSKNPELINKFDLNKLKEIDVIKLLSKQPQFINIDSFQKHIKLDLQSLGNYYLTYFWIELYGYNISDQEKRDKQNKIFLNALAKYPQYREIFKKNLYDEKYVIPELLERDYSLLQYFDLTKLEGWTLRKTLEIFPDLIDKITDEQLKTIDSDNYFLKRLLEKQPQLKPYFDKVKNK